MQENSIPEMNIFYRFELIHRFFWLVTIIIIRHTIVGCTENV